jgi:hypothetical protein
MLSPVASFFLYVVGCALLVAAARWWRPVVTWKTGAAYAALTTAFFAVPLLTGALQVPTDLAYEALPYSDTVPERDQPHNFFQADTLYEQVPFHALVRARILRGEVPLWSNELGTGAPLLGNGQAAPFAPLHLLALPLSPLRGLTVAGAWQILVGFLCMHALLLWLGAGRSGAALGAIAAGLSTYAVAWIYDTPGMAAAFVPGLFLGILMVRAGARRGVTGLIACALGLALSGHPETMAHAGMAAVLLVAVLLLRPNPQGQQRPRFLGRLAFAALMALLLSAPAILPLIEDVPDSVRGSALARASENFQPPPVEKGFLLTLFSPEAVGSPPDGTYLLKWSFNEIATGYAGLVALVLALSGALLLRGKALVALLCGAVALAVALRLPPLFDWLLRAPIVGPIAHGRLREFWVFAVATAAALTLDRVASRPAIRWTVSALLVVALGAVAATPPPAPAPWPWAWWVGALIGALGCLLTLVIAPWRKWFAPAAVAAVAVDLFVLGVRYHPPVPVTEALQPPASVDFLMKRNEISPTPIRISFENTDLPPNLNALYGLWDPRGYDPMRPEHAAHMVGWWLGHRRRFYQNISDSLRNLNDAAHDYLAVRYMGTSHERALPKPWKLLFDGQGGRIWENPDALPLFFVPTTKAKADSLEAAQQASMRNEDFSETVWSSTSPAGPQNGKVATIATANNGFDLTLDVPQPALVASSVSYTHGWQVEVDGRPAPVVEVNGGFLGFEAPAGGRSVQLRYAPKSWPIGLALAALGVILSLTAMLVSRGSKPLPSPMRPT